MHYKLEVFHIFGLVNVATIVLSIRPRLELPSDLSEDKVICISNLVIASVNYRKTWYQ